MLDLWKLQDFAPGDGMRARAFAEEVADASWLDLPAPGDVHRALIAAGRIPDPFHDRNEEACAWMEEREWWARCRFNGPPALQAGERLRLIFHGLDTYATIWLNGQLLGRHANMFREAVFDVSALVRPGAPNTLAVCFDPPQLHLPPDQVQFHPWAGFAERAWMRKAQFGYGWDWGPRLPTIGLWRPVELRREHQAAIGGVHFYTLEIAPGARHALVAVRVEVDSFAAAGPLQVTAELSRDGRRIGTTLHPDDSGIATAYLSVPDPALWWTHDLGEPALYDLSLTLWAGETPLEQRVQQVGIRTIALDQSPDTDEPGTRFFRFVLNGVPIFARGADWIPTDSFVGAIPAEMFERELKMARDAHMNMLRIWGGGLYEHDIFYDLCDRLGILIWQDFMFACATYPDHDPAFAAEVEAEARYQVRRLRNHPSLALWCGNNENQWNYEQTFWMMPGQPVPGADFYHRLLPEVVAALDGHVPYWPGSPYGGDDYNSMQDGDRHNWNVWHGNHDRHFGEEPKTSHTPEGVTYTRYAEDLGRFISEFGMHAAPVYETLRRVIPEDQRYHHSPALDHHNKDNPKNKGDALMIATTGLPETLEDYIDLSMIAQAEGLKFGIEHFRRRKPHCSGTLFWQLNDCWPVLSWSVIDYYGFGKAGYYYARRVYAPVLASFKISPDGGVALWLTNDTLAEVSDTITVQLGTFGGEVLHAETFEARIAANASAKVRAWTAAELPGGPDRYLAVWAAGESFPANRCFFGMIKDLERSPAAPGVEIIQAGERELQVTLAAPPDGYVYFAHLIVPDEHTRYTDNYFDLRPGETRTITVTNPLTPLSPAMVTVRWR